jgi:hypothetical protein
MTRFALTLALALAVSPAAFASQLSFDVRKTASCGCCQHWIDYIEAAGHKVEASNMDMGSLTRHKMKLGMQPQYASCHTATVEGYVIEGHVPVEDIVRLLDEKPDAIGLSAPGMPVGSPGMDGGKTYREAYDVVLVMKDGTSKVWTSYAARN